MKVPDVASRVLMKSSELSPLVLSSKARRTQEQPINALIVAALANPDLINLAAVPADENGMDVGALEQLLVKLEREKRLSRVRMVYCTSYFDNPTGLTLSRERREPMVRIVKRFSREHRILILEDAAYRELVYDG